jgi:thiamine-monophosphate kinase
MMAKANEFSIIERYFAPLARGAEGALELKDDAGFLTCAPSTDMVVTKDALVEGVHFLSSDSPDQIAKKLLRVNLSDLAAKGAKPLHYLLACAWPKETPEQWIAEFAEGLRQDQEHFGLWLLGGDTVSTEGPKVFSLTAIGTCPAGTMIKRSGAKVGDLVCVSGTIGDAGLGLAVLKGALALNPQEGAFLRQRYLLPQPRLELGQYLVGKANACVDVSDGLMADCAHIAETSGVRIEIRSEDIPISPSARVAIEEGHCTISDLCVSGDDYELCFTIPPERFAQLEPSRLGDGVEIIGKVMAGTGAILKDSNDQEITLKTKGYQHL